MTAVDEPVEAHRAEAGSGSAGSWLRDHGYALGLALVAVVATVVRFVNILVWRPTCREDLVAVVQAGGQVGFDPNAGNPACFGIWGDSAYHYFQGRMLAQGHGFIDSYSWFASGGTVYKPSAGDPPLYAIFLAVLSKLGLTGGTSMRLATALVGVGGVVLLALLVRRLAGRRAALIAGAIAAVYPLLWINDGMLLSEGLYVPLVVLALHAAYQFWERPTPVWAAAFGGAMALAALTRGEALILFGAMVLPLLWGLRALGGKRLVGLTAVIGVTGALLTAPWFAYNLSRFANPVLMTSGTGAVLSSASCDTAYEGEYAGYYANCFDEYVQRGWLIGIVPTCDEAAVAAAIADRTSDEAGRCWPNDPSLDESQRDKISQDLAMRYIREHKRQLPAVMLKRVGRIWDLYVPQLGEPQEPLGQNVRLNWQVEGRGQLPSELGVLLYWALLPAAAIGGWRLWRRRVPISPLLSLAVVITVTGAFTFGVTRYRVPVDIMVVVFAACAAGALLERWWPTGDTGTLSRLRPGLRGGDGPAAVDGAAPVDAPRPTEESHA